MGGISYLALAFALPALALTRAERITGLVLLLLYWRSNNLAQLTGLKSPESLFSPGSTIEALAAMGALMIFVAVLLRQGYSALAPVPSR